MFNNQRLKWIGKQAMLVTVLFKVILQYISCNSSFIVQSLLNFAVI